MTVSSDPLPFDLPYAYVAVDADAPGACAFPRLPHDDPAPGGAEAVFLRAALPQADAAKVDVRRDGDAWRFTNGAFALRVPADGQWTPPFPGPLLSWSRDGGRTWHGDGRVVDAPSRGRVSTRIDVQGPAGLQWTTRYAWDDEGGFVLRARWIAGSDTLEIVEDIAEDSAAYWRWQPFHGPARAWIGGGGEHHGPMRPAAVADLPGGQRGIGARCVARVAHIAYFGQWCPAWVGFDEAGARPAGDPSTGTNDASAGDALRPFAGCFGLRGGLWRRRGAVRPEAWDDDDTGAHARFPIRAGRRIWGLTLGDTASSRMRSATERTLLNTRKIEHGDLAPAKTRAWDLDPPVPPRALRLLAPDDVRRMRGHQRDPVVRAWAEQILHGRGPHGHYARPTARLFLTPDAPDAASWRAWADETLDRLRGGGYEGIVIFEGRAAKRLAYEFDWAWAEGALSEADYRHVRRALLALAHVYADPDYARYADFDDPRDDDPTVPAAMRDEMGDSPVPPNFASEFLTTVGVVAALFPEHPRADTWRRFVEYEVERFLDIWFAPDGTYRESINYHSHALAELGTYFHALRANGGRDFYAHPAVAGSYRMFCELLTPPLDAPPDGDGLDTFGRPRAAPAPRAAYHPPNGNSGGHGHPQEVRDDLLVAVDAYRDTDPALAGRLRRAWRLAGGPVFGHDAPWLSLAVYRPDEAEADEPGDSVHRDGLGVVSKATDAEGSPRYALFRAGTATHHMDFDQGGLYVVAGARVLLGDHGYHTADNDGQGLPAADTWLHSTVTYAENRAWSSGYAGLEHAPAPRLVDLDARRDYAVLDIVNTNFRWLERLAYTQRIPCAPIRHVRRYCYLKPDWWIVGDVFLSPPDDALRPVAWLWPTDAPQAVDGDGAAFQCGQPDARGPALWGRWLHGAHPETVFSRKVGPLHGLGCGGDARTGFLCAFTTRRDGEAPFATWDASTRTIRLGAARAAYRITWPRDADLDARPEIIPEE